MKKAIQFGAGNIGRGFIGALLSEAGYKVVFADVSRAIIDKINEDKQYTVHIMDTECTDVLITNVCGVDSTTPAVVDEIVTADVLTTAVGLTILPRIAPTIAKAIEQRREKNVKTVLNVIACENAIRGTSQLKKSVYESLSTEGAAYADKMVGFADCAVDRIVPPVKSENFIDVVVERYHEWDVEKSGLKGEALQIGGMTLVDDLSAYIERKLFTLNTGHAITAYLGSLRGLPTIADGIADADIHAVVSQAMQESGAGLIKKYSFDPAKHAAYIQTILGRFTNPYLKDDVTRVGREPLRKLSATDRLIYPAMTAHGYGLPVDHLLVGAAAALCYHNPEDKQSVELQDKLAKQDVVAVLTEVTGVTDTEILNKIKQIYDLLKNHPAADAIKELAK